MSEQHPGRPGTHAEFPRRRFLIVIGGSVISLPLLGLTGCMPQEAEPPPTPDNDPTKEDTGTDSATPQPSGTEASTTAEPAPADAEDLPKLDENSQLAQALGYTHDASTVDPAQFPSRDADALCKNCANFQGSPGQQWGPCTIFPGKAVNADGWCSVYVAAA